MTWARRFQLAPFVAFGVTLIGCSDVADDAERAGPEAVGTAESVEFAGVDFDVRRDPG